MPNECVSGFRWGFLQPSLQPIPLFAQIMSNAPNRAAKANPPPADGKLKIKIGLRKQACL
jgi:hypothetical protein